MKLGKGKVGEAKVGKGKVWEGRKCTVTETNTHKIAWWKLYLDTISSEFVILHFWIPTFTFQAWDIYHLLFESQFDFKVTWPFQIDIKNKGNLTLIIYHGRIFSKWWTSYNLEGTVTKFYAWIPPPSFQLLNLPCHTPSSRSRRRRGCCEMSTLCCPARLPSYQIISLNVKKMVKF